MEYQHITQIAFYSNKMKVPWDIILALDIVSVFPHLSSHGLFPMSLFDLLFTEQVGICLFVDSSVV